VFSGEVASRLELNGQAHMRRNFPGLLAPFPVHLNRSSLNVDRLRPPTFSASSICCENVVSQNPVFKDVHSI
jgi:hypothetical protein